ncbi:relaxase/mobilization nuclease domain-containing protein [Intestinibacillus sp. Marseille-P6563]|uniref:relaxase/mobilization nuclease domain-containing protein n=1 Tax=Intestinibacillus sp. Marseille-P6563 TaxID=2364792 RepID=UPI000F059D6D|nr:relaxase/mobilization nuclease domain-containing protein [Intestinibacillus sp. Marseille-P6563]
MATIKHISSKNADYGAAEAYLTFEHDEFTMKPTLDENGRLVPRQDYRLDTLNCGGEDFALSCIRANLRYGKNSKREDIKSHHYIISFDPLDAADNGLTVDRAQALGLAYCKEHFHGHQALVCTHPDGHNHSGNIHVHIVINSLRVAEVERKPYMDRASDTRAGDKHRCTAAAMRYFRSEVMEMCHREGLYQIDLLNGGKNKVTEREYWAKRKGQAKLDKENAVLLAEGIAPRQTKFETDKDRLRQSIRAALSKAKSFEDFSAVLMQDYGISVKESRGRLSYLTPDRTKPITARKLGTDFDKAAVFAVFQQNAHRAAVKIQGGQEYQPPISEGIRQQKPAKITPHPDSPQRLVDIAAKRAEGKGIGYERWAKTFNLKQMAKTVNFLTEHGFTSPEEVDAALTAAISEQRTTGEKLKELESKITANKELLRQISVYRKTKPVHVGLKTAKKPEQYREYHRSDLTLYEAAVRYFRERGLKKLPAVSKLQAENEALISEKNGLYTEYREQKARAAELQKVKSNLAAMLRQERTKEVRRDWER